MLSTDFLIFGLGPAGCAAAVFAAQAGASVVLAGLTPSGIRFGEHLPPEANPLLRDLGIDSPSLLCAGVSSWWGGVESCQDSIFHPQGSGCFVARPDFEHALLSEARRLGVSVLENYVLEKHSGSRFTLSSADSQTVDSSFTIDATGRAAAVARRLGGRRQRVDRLTAVGTRLECTNRDRRLLVEAVPSGWWYSCPLPNQQRSVVFLTDSDLPQFKQAREPEGWLGLMGPRIQEVVGVPSLPQTLVIAPADSAYLAPSSGHGWAAVGDAAMSFDPLASRGLHHAMASAWRAVRGESSQPTNFDKYLEQKRQCYLLEHRFMGEEFWARRRRGSSRHEPNPLSHKGARLR